MADFDDFTTAYLIAALWAATDDFEAEMILKLYFFVEAACDSIALDDEYKIKDIEAATLAEMVADCRRFQEANSALIIDKNVFVESPDDCDYSCNARAGHDFLLTRNYHGSGGFWGGSWKRPASKKLTEAAHSFGEYILTETGNGGYSRFVDCKG